MEATQAGTEQILDEHSVRRHVFAPHMAVERAGVRSLLGYPNAFEFQERDGKRAESVVWDMHCDKESTLRLGADMAAVKREAKRAAKPDAPDDALPTYAGYLQANVGLIRASKFKGVPVVSGERRCVPGVFEVEHYPENGLHAHAHVLLLADFVQALNQQMTIDGTPGAGSLSRKQAFPAALHMLLGTFEIENFVCHDGSTCSPGATILA